MLRRTVASLLSALVALVALVAGASPSAADAEPVWVSVDREVLESVSWRLGESYQPIWTERGRAVVLVSPAEIEALGLAIHEQLNRCGGFAVHADFDEAVAAARFRRLALRAGDFTIDSPGVVEPVIAGLVEDNVLATIVELSSFENRYYTSTSGVEAAEWLADQWRALAPDRDDVAVELIDHVAYPQRSVMLQLEGSERPEEIVVVGGHLDSIAPGREDARAPGADDNASGISVMTEIARALLSQGYRPERTVRFYGFAAEEVGLRGSRDIAKRAAEAGENIISMVQLDMVNYPGSDVDIAIMADDYTDAALNAFLGDLIDAYVGVQWVFDRCGYSCSDHAAFASEGFAAASPFEARASDYNRTIHTPNDTLDVSDHSAAHAMSFAKLGAAYVIEAAKGSLEAPPECDDRRPCPDGSSCVEGMCVPDEVPEPGEQPGEPDAGSASGAEPDSDSTGTGEPEPRGGCQVASRTGMVPVLLAGLALALGRRRRPRPR